MNDKPPDPLKTRIPPPGTDPEGSEPAWMEAYPKVGRPSFICFTSYLPCHKTEPDRLCVQIGKALTLPIETQTDAGSPLSPGSTGLVEADGIEPTTSSLQS